MRHPVFSFAKSSNPIQGAKESPLPDISGIISKSHSFPTRIVIAMVTSLFLKKERAY